VNTHPKSRAASSLIVAAVILCSPGRTAGEDLPGELDGQSGVVVLDTRSVWRCYSVRGSELARKESGRLQPLYELRPANLDKVEGRYVMRTREMDAISHTPVPPADWNSPDFDDSPWVLSPGPFYAFIKEGESYHGGFRPVMLIYARGKFPVEDPAKVDGLQLSLAFHGGAVVYLNGREIARVHLPAGEVQPTTPAEDYPPEAFFNPDGGSLRYRHGGDPEKYPERFAMRTRRIEGLRIPGSLLRRGVNVLAIELHRAPAPAAMFLNRTKECHASECVWWPRVALQSVRLTAPADSAVVANVARPEGLHVWNENLLSRVYLLSRGDPNEPIRPIELCGARGGVYSGKIVVGSTEPIRGLKAELGDLTGPRTIPAASAQVRYGRMDGLRRYRSDVPYFDALDDTPPQEVPLAEYAPAAVQTVWVTVRVPRDAAPGQYRAALRVSAERLGPVEVPVRLRVIGFTLPDPKDFITHVGLMQSPESVALHYGVPLWSDEHWKLIERSLAWMGHVGTKTLYITMVRRTHFGNEHSMVRWVRQPDGSLEPDYRIAEKYLDLALKHLGTIRVVGLYCWEPLRTGHYSQKTFYGDRDILISVLDPATGKLEEAKGPDWGTPAACAFWKEAFDGMKQMLGKRGLEDAMMIGISGDYAPSKQVAEDLSSAAPEQKWIAQSHVFWDDVHGHAVGYLVVLWGMVGLSDPAYPALGGVRRFYGWRDAPLVVARFPRDELRLPSAPLGRWYIYPEEWMVAQGKWLTREDPAGGDATRYWSGTCGFGRLGADFWPVIEDGQGRKERVITRYPDESSWGQLTLDYSNPALLAPGPDGAVATARLELLREGLQQAEARVFLEKALVDPRQRARLGAPLAERCQAILDERVRDFIRAVGGKRSSDWLWFISAGWQQRSEQLYAAAADVAEALEGGVASLECGDSSPLSSASETHRALGSFALAEESGSDRESPRSNASESRCVLGSETGCVLENFALVSESGDKSPHSKR